MTLEVPSVTVVERRTDVLSTVVTVLFHHKLEVLATKAPGDSFSLASESFLLLLLIYFSCFSPPIHPHSLGNRG